LGTVSRSECPVNPPADGRAFEEKPAFRKAVGVATVINAPPDRVWSLLTQAAGIPRWTSTVSHISGRIALGETLAITVPMSKRVFTVMVDVFEPAKRLVWSDGNAVLRGVRTYALAPRAGGGTSFSLVEVFTGLLLPLIAPSLPDFKPMFEQYAADLKTKAEQA
jgi:uncharacterized protein YndB with AHSA1/START domain